MHLIPTPSLFIPDNRQRRDFPQDQLNELAESIRTHGLFHPIVVTPDDERYRLVAGERRFRAITQLFELGISFTCGTERCTPGNVPVTLLAELDPLTLREIELEENTIRVDLSWQERAQAIAALDALRKEQQPDHTISDTAREVFGYSGAGTEKVRESIVLAESLSDPDVAKAKSHAEAVKVVRKKREAAHRLHLAAQFTPTESDHQILQGDSREILKTLPPGKFSCVITDPPYGVGADNFGSQAGTAHTYADDRDYARECYHALAEESFRVCAESAHAYVFHTIELFPAIAKLFAAAGWDVWPRPLIWYKGNGMLPRPDHGPRYTYESILFASKGDRLILRPGLHDVLSYPPPSDKLHAAEKPVDLLIDLLSRSCNPGDAILDPFAGSGPVFLAAAKSKLRVTGIELDPQHIATCKLRIQESL